MTEAERELIGWRQWAGVEVLAHLVRVHAPEQARRILSAAADKAYALIFGNAAESALAVDVEILHRLATDGGWNGLSFLVEARKILQTGRKMDPVAVLVSGLSDRLRAAGLADDFLAGVCATQAFYQGEPDGLLLRLRVIAAPHASELDLSILEGGPTADAPEPSGEVTAANVEMGGVAAKLAATTPSAELTPQAGPDHVLAATTVEPVEAPAENELKCQPPGP